MKNKELKDPINHPTHYADSCSLECIEVMSLLFPPEGFVSYCLANAFKYMWRYRHKNGVEDLKKAEWYLNYISGIELPATGNGFELRQQAFRFRCLLCKLKDRKEKDE